MNARARQSVGAMRRLTWSPERVLRYLIEDAVGAAMDFGYEVRRFLRRVFSADAPRRRGWSRRR